MCAPYGFAFGEGSLRFARRISQDFREDHPQFAAALTAAKSRFDLSDAETAAILAESVS